MLNVIAIASLVSEIQLAKERHTHTHTHTHTLNTQTRVYFKICKRKRVLSKLHSCHSLTHMKREPFGIRLCHLD